MLQPFQLAMLVGDTAATSQMVRDYTMNLGLAFQIVDDYWYVWRRRRKAKQSEDITEANYRRVSVLKRRC
jgi:geranylgeranyl pyrophosphate synthase